MYEILTVGSAVVDILVQSDQFKVLKSHQVDGGLAMCEVYGGKAEVEHIDLCIGGGAMNAAVGFRRKGALTAPIVKIGSDWAAELIMRSVHTEGLGRDLIIQADGETGMSVVLVATGGGRSILTHRGIGAEISSSEVNWDVCRGAKWVYVASTGGNKSYIEDIFSVATNNGTKISFNPGKGEISWGKDLLRFLRKADVVFMNRSELTSWLKIQYEDDLKIYEEIKKMQLRMLVITEGNKGASVYSQDKVIRASAFDVKSIDDTGAGDAFGSSFVWAISQGWDIVESLKFGSANAASVVMHLGATEGLLDLNGYKNWQKRNLVIEESPY